MFRFPLLLSVVGVSAYFVIFPVVVADGGGDNDDPEQARPGPPDFCLEGPYHKDTPSPEEEGFTECLSWQNLTCCNVELSETIRISKAVGLYNFSWDLCGNLSHDCENYIKDEECFYQCEPMLGYFEIAKTGYIANVPVCADYCDAWFEACKDDMTCVEDWLGDYHYVEDANICPNGSQCITFKQMYGNGEGLCNKMWGNAFFYERSNNCTVMKFDPSSGNPNFELQLPVSSAGSQYTTSHMLWPLVTMLAIMRVVV